MSFVPLVPSGQTSLLTDFPQRQIGQLCLGALSSVCSLVYTLLPLLLLLPLLFFLLGCVKYLFTQIGEERLFSPSSALLLPL